MFETGASDATTTITAIHPDIIQSHILNNLDGPTLASISCTSSQLLSMCTSNQLWTNICNSTWPSTTDPRVKSAISSFPNGHRSFYSDSFPSIHQNHSIINHPLNTSELISAVDIFCDEKLIYSKVVVTETISDWFLTSPFRLDLLDTKETVPTPVKFDAEDDDFAGISADRLRLSWILIDPVNNRAANFSGSAAVDARRHWLTEDVQLRFASVVAGVFQCGVVVTCGGVEGGKMHVREVTMQVEDMEGKIVSGRDSLVILRGAMEGQRCKMDGEMEKGIYRRFLRMKVEARERELRRERLLDVACLAAGLSIIFAIWMFFLRGL